MTEPRGAGRLGYPIVLTASRAEISQYGGDPFRAFICTFPEFLSRRALNGYLSEEGPSDGPARFAPYGLRKVEAILSKEFGSENVVTCHPDRLGEFVGPQTKLVCISTMDPVGLAYVSTTYNSLIGFGGEALNAAEFRRLLSDPAIIRHKPKIIVGGAGVWQIRDAGLQSPLGIDLLFHGEAEADLVPVVRSVLEGACGDSYVDASEADRSAVPLIMRPATYGAVEITRGCGRGCAFCSPTNRRKHSFPLEHIMEEVRVNVEGGSKAIFTVTEDMFLYKSHPGFIPNTPEVVRLYKTIASYPGVEHILLSHASLAPVLYDRALLDELTPVLMEKTYWTPERGYRQRYITVEVGIETGSVRLMRKHMKGKALPFTVDRWPELVLQGIGQMNDHDWWPLCTIMTGQPDETEDDVIATLDLIDDLRAQNAKMFYTPVLFIPLEDAMLNHAKRSNLESLTELQWMVLTKCWRNNIDFWQPERSWLYSTMFFLSHWLYARWRHGRKSTRPMMHLAGFKDDSLAFALMDKLDLSREFMRDKAHTTMEVLGLR
ncbi:MAG: radical SAM protein [Thermoplasmata archaeon]